MRKSILMVIGILLSVSLVMPVTTKAQTQKAANPETQKVGPCVTKVPTGFAYTNGTKFMLDGNPFYYAGTNNYYLNFYSKTSVDNVIDDAADMGLKVIRTWGDLEVGTATGTTDKYGNPVFTDNNDGVGQKCGVYYYYFDASKNRPVVNEGKDGLQVLDYAVYKASQRGIKVILDFTNNWDQFGGMMQYVKWAKLAGEKVSVHDDFYTNETIKGWYKDYINTMLNRKNVYSGIAYKDDPTIFSWELANEPEAKTDPGCAKGVLTNWVTEMSAYIKSVDPYHMVTVGDEGFYNFPYNGDTTVPDLYVYHGGAGDDWKAFINTPNIDFETIHMYCDSWGLSQAQGNEWLKNHGEIAKAANKPVILEEYGLTDKTTRNARFKEWFDIMEGKTYPGIEYGGSNFWMIASITDSGSLYTDYDGYTIYYRGDSNGNPTADIALEIAAHAARMTAKNVVLIKTGDVNGDSKVNILDYLYLKRYIAGAVTKFPNDKGSKAADMNGDGKINSEDYILLRKLILSRR